MGEIITKQPYTSETFALEVERRVSEENDLTYLTATSELIEEMDCEPSEVVHLISPTLKQKIAAEASERGLLSERNRSTSLFGFMA